MGGPWSVVFLDWGSESPWRTSSGFLCLAVSSLRRSHSPASSLPFRSLAYSLPRSLALALSPMLSDPHTLSVHPPLHPRTPCPTFFARPGLHSLTLSRAHPLAQPCTPSLEQARSGFLSRSLIRSSPTFVGTPSPLSCCFPSLLALSPSPSTLSSSLAPSSPLHPHACTLARARTLANTLFPCTKAEQPTCAHSIAINALPSGYN